MAKDIVSKLKAVLKDKLLTLSSLNTIKHICSFVIRLKINQNII